METKFPSNSARGRAGEERVGADARGPKVSEKKEGGKGARAAGLPGRRWAVLAGREGGDAGGGGVSWAAAWFTRE